MTATNFNMRIDSETKEQLTAVLADYGLTMPQAIKLFANQVIKTKEVPLSFDWASDISKPIPNQLTQQAMQEALNRTDYSESYSPDEVMQAIQEIANA